MKEIGGLYTADQVAKELGLNRITIWRWRNAGRIVPVKVAGAYYYPQSEIDRMKSQRGVEALR